MIFSASVLYAFVAYFVMYVLVWVIEMLFKARYGRLTISNFRRFLWITVPAVFAAAALVFVALEDPIGLDALFSPHRSDPLWANPVFYGFSTGFLLGSFVSRRAERAACRFVGIAHN